VSRRPGPPAVRGERDAGRPADGPAVPGLPPGGPGPRTRGPGRGQGAGSGHGPGVGGSGAASLSGFSTPPYPSDARARGDEGTVELTVRVSTGGAPLDVSLASSSGSGSLDRAAISGVKRAHFRPAMQDGMPVEGTTRVSVVFRLDP